MLNSAKIDLKGIENMKKFNLIVLGLCAFLSGCQTCTNCRNKVCDKFYAMNLGQKPAAETVAVVQAEQYQTVAPAVAPIKDNQIRYYVVEQDTSCISESAAIKAPVVSKDVKVNASDYESFSRRVAVKAKSDNFVTYEYRDIRVDELMPLAAHYCNEHGNRTAILRKINLYHGYYRRVTFDCVRL